MSDGRADTPPGTTAARLTVRDVLDLDLVMTWGPEVVAGAVHLDHPVRWLHVAEAPDVGVMLTGGEMVLTTGLLLAGDERVQVEYVESMQRADVAAVVLGLGRAFRTTPEPMRRAAERCGVPLIVLHRPAPFARLTEEVHARLVYGRFAALDLSDRVRSSLTALNLSGAGLQQVLDEIAAHAGCPAVVVNLAQRVLASAGDKGSLDDLLRDWERVSGRSPNWRQRRGHGRPGRMGRRAAGGPGPAVGAPGALRPPRSGGVRPGAGCPCLRGAGDAPPPGRPGTGLGGPGRRVAAARPGDGHRTHRAVGQPGAGRGAPGGPAHLCPRRRPPPRPGAAGPGHHAGAARAGAGRTPRGRGARGADRRRRYGGRC